MKVAAVILAAGASTRLGRPKQLAQVGGELLLERAVRVACEASCAPVVAVLGAAAERIQAECALGSARIVVNDLWAEGMASSLRAGIAALGDEADGVLVMTCDQPAVTPEHLRELVELGGGGAVASSYAGRCGVPAFFPANLFGALLMLRGDVGARQLLQSVPALELARGELDIDTVETLETAQALFGGASASGSGAG